jgi:hypothetical protein
MGGRLMTEEVQALLGGYAAGILTEAERRRLLETALRDQEVFDALAAELPLKELLDEAAVRRQLLAALEGRRRPLWLSIPAWAGAAAAIAVVALLLPRPTPTTGPSQESPWARPVARPAGSDAERAYRQLLDLPLRPDAATLTLAVDSDDGRFRLGARLRLHVTARQAGNLLMLEEREDGALTVLFPNEAQPFSRIVAGATLSVPPADQPGLALTPPAGSRRLRLAVLPVDVDPSAVNPSQIALSKDRIGLTEQRYVVVP